MFGSDIIELALALVFVFFIISLLCSTVTEFISRIFKMRANTLKDGIKRLLDDENLKNSIFNHALIKGLSPKEKNPQKNDKGPSNIPARTFSQVMFDTIAKIGSGKASTGNVVDDLENNIKAMPAKVQEVLQALLTSAKSHTYKAEEIITEFQHSIESWFDDSMDRVSGWYKRKSQYIILAVAFVVCLALNIDTFVIAKTLYQDTTLRASVVAAAEARAQQPYSEESEEDLTIEELRDELSGLNIPIGWSGDAESPNKAPDNFAGWIIKLLGVIFTTFAASLGASFWFDLLGKIANLRASGKKPARADETSAAGTSPTKP